MDKRSVDSFFLGGYGLQGIEADCWEGAAMKHFAVKKEVFFGWKGGREFSEWGVGKAFYRKGNSVKRSRPFSEPPDSENWKVAVLIPFPKIGSFLQCCEGHTFQPCSEILRGHSSRQFEKQGVRSVQGRDAMSNLVDRQIFVWLSAKVPEFLRSFDLWSSAEVRLTWATSYLQLLPGQSCYKKLFTKINIWEQFVL